MVAVLFISICNLKQLSLFVLIYEADDNGVHSIISRVKPVWHNPDRKNWFGVVLGRIYKNGLYFRLWDKIGVSLHQPEKLAGIKKRIFCFWIFGFIRYLYVIAGKNSCILNDEWTERVWFCFKYCICMPNRGVLWMNGRYRLFYVWNCLFEVFDKKRWTRSLILLSKAGFSFL